LGGRTGKSRHGLFWSASQASALDGRTGKSRHGLFWSASQSSALGGQVSGRSGAETSLG
jgi:type IV secretory pathway VirB3-like protein